MKISKSLIAVFGLVLGLNATTAHAAGEATAAAVKAPPAGLADCPSLESLDARQKALRADLAKTAAAEAEPANPALRAELVKMRDRDQGARAAASASARANGGRPDQALVFDIFQADQENLSRFREIVEAGGFPDAKTVGREGVAAAFILAQHADSDREFQAKALALMTPLAANHEVAPQDLALLTDRVRIGAGQPQLYGSQFRVVDSVNHPQPIEDAAGVDARRGQAGLLPLRDYGCIMQQAYGFPVDLQPHAQIVTR